MTPRADTRVARAADLEAAYARELQGYLERGGEDALRRAYEMGRAFFAGGRGILEVSAMHHAALAEALQRPGAAAALPRVLARAREFLGECLSPYEMAQRGFGEAIAALQSLNETLEGEIQRIAHDVHDEVGQLLVAARLKLADAARLAAPTQRHMLHELGAILDQAEEELRRISHELRPLVLDDLGLVPALELLASGVSSRAGLSVRVESSVAGRPPQRVETTLYRIVQEALANAVRHGRARKVTVRLFQDGPRLACRISDDGAGFDVQAALSSPGRRGLGLVGIRARLDAVGGTLQVASEPGRGSELVVRIPAEVGHAHPSDPRR